MNILLNIDNKLEIFGICNQYRTTLTKCRTSPIKVNVRNSGPILFCKSNNHIVWYGDYTSSISISKKSSHPSRKIPTISFSLILEVGRKNWNVPSEPIISEFYHIAVAFICFVFCNRNETLNKNQTHTLISQQSLHSHFKIGKKWKNNGENKQLAREIYV